MKQNQRVPCLNIEIAEHFCSDCDIRSNVNSEIRDTYARSNFYYLSILCCLKRKTISSYLRYSFHILLIICLITSAFGCGPGRSFGFSHRRNLNYRPKPLVQKEHVPNIPEQTLGASGVSEGAIKRDSPNFKKLIWVESDYIVFKDEEGTGADRFMSRINAGEEGLLVKKDKLKAYAKRFLKLNFVSKMGALDWLTNKSNIAPERHIKRLRTTDYGQRTLSANSVGHNVHKRHTSFICIFSTRCKDKLDILAISVINQWPTTRLRVIESWDEDGEYLHGKNSLHYEGRAVDITTDDRDTSKYGMLARLAVEAGFDWVYYENRDYIHCSVKSDSFHTPHDSGCFTKDSIVLTSNGSTKAMSDLIIGDRVLSVNDHGEPIFSEIILFMDRNLEQTEQFIQLTTEKGAVLTVTPAHLVMIWNPEKMLASYVFADQITRKDQVFVHDFTKALRPERVIKLETVTRKGVVAPLTRAGTIVVNSVAASCYAIVNSQKLAHWSLAPMRLWSSILSYMHPSNQSKETVKEEKRKKRLAVEEYQSGVHWYAKALYTIKDYVLPITWRH